METTIEKILPGNKKEIIRVSAAFTLGFLCCVGVGYWAVRRASRPSRDLNESRSNRSHLSSSVNVSSKYYHQKVQEEL